ncbi:uncharacterized protein sS8_0599 [Methylocaldum marinum]|uniref:Uncharacterized protein n=1 Tax=Methylocaldum marinum TaxID=1432792 RepID=A0A250KLX0_9GAMM|nr:hypothetical protein [Methylocaldum marinum]BBA32564.1 uncharacterized protein sS8_0599 [Methylocaldum marinum]
MAVIMPPQTVLTPAGAANDLQSNGLDALGLTVPNLSPVWSSSAPGEYVQAQLSLELTDVRAPFRGIREFVATPAYWSGVEGMPLAGPVAVFRLHPEAARRLETLVLARYGTPLIRPVPVAMVLRGITLPDPLPVPEWFFAGDPLDTAGEVVSTFHDARGLPVDPIAVADMFRDLLAWLPALRFNSGPAGNVGDAGGVGSIAGLAAGNLCHVIDPHGNGYVPARGQARLKVLDGSNNQVSEVTDSGIVALAAGQSLGRSAADNSADGDVRPVRWGWAQNGTLARAAIAPPALPSGVRLTRQFFRVLAVDLGWHLLGNRSTETVAGIPGDDDATPDFLLPQVRDPVPNFAYLTNGNDVLGAAAAMTAGFPPADGSSFAIVVSPVIDANLPAPPAPGPTSHWPAFPASGGNAPITAATDPARNISAVWRNQADGMNAGRDVIVTIAANSVPDGAHVRLFPRRFVEIAAITGDAPSFVRGDGGSAIAVSNNPTPILLVDPFLLSAGESRPTVISFDIVVTARTGQRRLFSEIRVRVDDVPASWNDNTASFGGAPILSGNGLQGLLDDLHTRGICTSPLFGVPRTFTPGQQSGGAADLARSFAREGQPRQGPRLPTQMRLETLLAIGSAAAADTALNWGAVLTGARWSPEMRSFRPDLGNPGNPAGLDAHASGIRADGWLAYDLALHAVKRAQPILPLGGDVPGWLLSTSGNNWNAPPADTTGTVAAAALETISPVSDTPELTVVTRPQPGDTVDDLVNTVATRFGVPAPDLDVVNAENLVKRVQKEIVAARSGLRDALWSLRRAFLEARELIYIEGPAFARTARPGDAPGDWQVDLVEVIRQRLVANKRLKVLICVPSWPDFDLGRAPWVRAALKHRKKAIEQLTTTDHDRVAAFHPIGFPGRPAAIRTTTVIVDDVYAFTGTSHIRRRGMTFDGSVDVASIDRAIADGYSVAIRQFRQQLMAHKLGVDIPGSPSAATPLWIRLGSPDSAFDAVSDLLQQGGLGRCAPVWAGPTDTSILPQSDDVADPDGMVVTDPASVHILMDLLAAELLSDGADNG